MIRSGRSQSRRWFRTMAALLAVMFAAGGLYAQSAPPRPITPVIPVAQNTDDFPGFAKPVDTQAPYAAWKNHVATKPEEAIVLVRYAATSDANAPLTTATGLVMRCDGFILVPKAVRNAAYENRHAEVVVQKADGPGSSGPTAAPARPHPGVNASVDYALVKINGYHIRCLPLLASENVTQGTPVQVLWATAASTGGGFTVTRHDATVSAPIDRTGTLALTSAAGFADVPPGAVIVDTQSGAAIGVATSGGPSPTFTTFARIRAISDEVGLAPTRDAVRLGNSQGKPPLDSEDMVWVPGGPMRVRQGTRFVKLYDTDVICTPGFYVDKYPVTNQQYRTWLYATHKRRGLPAGWNYQELQNPTRRDDLAVTGMLPEDADKYASERSARLLTEAEWLRASYTEDISWILATDLRWNEASRRIFDKLFNRIQRTRAAVKDAVDQLKLEQKKFDPATIRALPADEDGEFEDLANIVEDTLRQEKWMWGWAHPVGFYTEDVSTFGVGDVLTNPDEILQYSAGTSPTTPKLSPAGVDMYWNDFRWGADETPDAVALHDFYQKVFEILLWHDGWNGEGFTLSLQSGSTTGHDNYNVVSQGSGSNPTTVSNGTFTFIGPSGKIMGFYNAAITSHCDKAFRCAR